jgi:soluble calcium-activated nucleotidase 1
VTILDKHGGYRRIDWSKAFNFVRDALGAQYPGYVMHEAINWSPHMRKWVFAPRRISKEAYDDVKDEHRGSNKVVIVDEKFTKAEVVEVKMADKDGL